MSDTKTDGGPAFPLIGMGPEDGAPIEHHGMSLRDYFAAKVMQAMCSGAWPADQDAPEITRRSFLLADAMLAAREQT